MKTYYFVTLYPDVVNSYCAAGVFKRAASEQKIKIETIFLRDFAVDKHGSVDDKPYGGGAGMVMRPEPLAQAVQMIKAKDKNAVVILPDPKGFIWKQDQAENFAASEHSLIFICGRFEGIDQRFVDQYVDHVFSLGSFIISGGELAALVMAESMIRLQTLDKASLIDSFSSDLGGGLEYPQYTRPENFDGLDVPSVLLSGDHAKIAQWRQSQTKKK